MTHAQIINEAKKIDISPGALVSLSDLREAIGNSLTWLQFDQAIIDLANSGQVFLHRHVGTMIEQEQALENGAVSDDLGKVYVGMVIRW